jgi:hypothetical protein
VGAIGGAVGAVVVVVLVLILLSVVVAVCAVKTRRKYKLGKVHIHDPPTIGEYMYAVYVVKDQQWDKIFLHYFNHFLACLIKTPSDCFIT